VTADGKPVDFSVERVPTSSLEILLVVDTSGSMVGAPIEAARAAANEFLTVLPPDVRVGIVAFGSQPSLVAAPTTDRALLASGIGRLAAGGETALYRRGRLPADTQFSATAGDRAIVLLSDGGDTASTTTLDQAAAAGVRTNVIELVTAESDSAVLGRLAAAGGGSVSSVSDPAGPRRPLPRRGYQPHQPVPRRLPDRASRLT
jgi:tight adherence protein B